MVLPSPNPPKRPGTAPSLRRHRGPTLPRALPPKNPICRSVPDAGGLASWVSNWGWSEATLRTMGGFHPNLAACELLARGISGGAPARWGGLG